MRKLEAPKFLSELYRDLRDRRLLLPIAGLVVAIVAVPILLSGGSSAVAPPPPSAQAADSDASEVAPAVLVTDTGVREYRKRLAQLKASTPFKQQFALPPAKSVTLEDASAADAGAETGDVSGSGGSTSSFDTAVTDTVEAAGGSSSVTTDTTVTEPAGDQVDASVTEEPEPPKPEIRFYAGRIDVTVGELGDAKRVDGVRYLDLLPSESRPVVAFLGLAHGGEGAVFSVSRDVVETDGDGSCAPKKPAPCQFLTMHVGDKRTFKYADGTTFRLTLRDTDVVRVPDPRKQHAGDQASEPAD